jgi:hypothetical protein
VPTTDPSDEQQRSTEADPEPDRGVGEIELVLRRLSCSPFGTKPSSEPSRRRRGNDLRTARLSCDFSPGRPCGHADRLRRRRGDRRGDDRRGEYETLLHDDSFRSCGID